MVGAAVVVPWVLRTGATEVDLTQYNLDFSAAEDDTSQYMSLSDVEAKLARVGWGSFLKDQTSDGKMITLNYNGGTMSFERGLWTHASSNIYYDLEALGMSGVYDYLTAYVGLNTSSTSGNGVTFWVYGANEWAETGSVWTVLYNQESKKTLPKEEADYIKVPIAGYRYIRLQVSDNGGNGQDHAVWADARLVKEGYNPFLVPSMTEIDAELAEMGELDVLNNVAHELLVLRRELFNKVGQYTLTEFIKKSDENREALGWLVNDIETLRLYMHGGRPAGTYAQSLQVLSDLYAEYKEDLNNTEPLFTVMGGKRGDLYRKMMITLSLTHSRQVRLWVRDRIASANGAVVNYEAPDSPNVSRAVDRYKVYKRMHVAGKLNNAVFEQLEVEEMRYVMNTMMGDDEVEWLNDYLRAKGKTPYSWPMLAYKDAGYWHLEDFAEENQEAIAQQWLLKGDNYEITNRPYEPHLWMIFKWGGKCWQISDTAQNMAASYGIPSTTLGQRPDHVSYSHYSLGANGVASWGLSNDVYGWEKTDFVGYDGISSYRYSNDPMRHMNDWGFAYDKRGYAYRYNATYLQLAQMAINDYENYEKADALVMLADVYDGDLEKREEIYRKALEVQPINLDAWLGIIYDYKANPAKTDEDYFELAKEVISVYGTTHPVPMYDMLRQIFPEFESKAFVAALDVRQTKALTDMAPSGCRTWACRMARQLLGLVDDEVAVFSFDGENAGKLKLGSKYSGVEARWEYSLDGGVTWTDAGETDTVDLVENGRIEEISVDDDIKIYIVGAAKEPENIYTIDITKATLPSNLYANDDENRVVGVNTTMEWREVTLAEDGTVASTGDWMAYRDSSPQWTGDITVQVRVGATGTKLPSDASGVHTFTQDPEVNLQRVYMPVSHLSVAAVSSQATSNAGNAIYAIDGNPNTRWHSAWDGTDRTKEFTVKFDHTVKLSAFEYMPAGGGNGRFLEVDFYGSEDGEEFRLIGKVANSCEGATVPCTTAWPNVDNMELRKFEFAREGEDGELVYEPVELNYLKIHGVQTSAASSSLSFATARMFKFYEDRSEYEGVPTGSVAYSEIVPTREDVIARLKVSGEIEVLSTTNTEDPYTYIFTENGEFTFVFRDNTTGKTGQAIAKVDWIYKNMTVQPEVIYSCAEEAGATEERDCSGASGKVNRSVVAQLVFPDDQTYTILGGEQEERGAQDTPAEDGLRLMNDEEQGGNTDPYSYLFMENGTITVRFADEAGNEGAKAITVDWIDKVPPKGMIIYSTTEETEGEVIAKVVRPSEVANVGGEGELETQRVNREGDLGDEVDEEFYVLNNNGSAEYRFTENGSFIFEISDEAGNRAAVLAKVDWIKKTEQPDVPEVPDNPNPDNPNPDNPGGTPGEPDKPITPDQPSVPDQPTPNDPSEGTTGGPNISENPNAPTGGQDGNQTQGGGAGAQQPSVNRPVGGGIGNGDQIAEVTDGTVNDQEIDENTGDGANGSTNGGGSSVGKPTVTGKEDDDVDGEFSQGEWYENPVIWWIAGGVVVVIIAGVAIGAISNRRR